MKVLEVRTSDGNNKERHMTIQEMVDAANKRLALWIARAVGQNKRRAKNWKPS